MCVVCVCVGLCVCVVCVCVCGVVCECVCVGVCVWCVCLVCVTLGTQHAMCMQRIILQSVACSALKYFSTLPHKRHDFRKKKSY